MNKKVYSPRRGFSVIAGIIIVAIGAVGLGGYLALKNKPFTTNQSAISEETKDWKAYKNERYGFEVKYPKESFTRTCSDDGDGSGGCYEGMEEWFDREYQFEGFNISFGPSSSKQGGGIWGISLINKGEIEQIISNLCEGFDNCIESRTNIFIDNHSALMVAVKTDYWTIRKIFVEKDGQVFLIDENHGTEPGFENFYKSFKFIERQKIAFFNEPHKLEVVVPEGYFIFSNHYGGLDPSLAESFVFKKKLEDGAPYDGVPSLGIYPMKLLPGQTFDQLAKYIYEKNKSLGYATTELKDVIYNVKAYEFGIERAYDEGENIYQGRAYGMGMSLDSPGGKAILIQRGDTMLRIIQTGADLGLDKILKSLKFR